MAYLPEKRRFAPQVLRLNGGMTMVIFLPSSVESCGGGHGTSSRAEEVCPSIPKKERVRTMASSSLPQ